MIRILVVDDQTLVRSGICNLLGLSPDMDVVGQCADGEGALTAIEQLQPDVVLLDIRMPGLSGIDVLVALTAQEAAPPCILLTTFDDPELVLKGMRAGAKGYLLKDVSLSQLESAIRTVRDGGTVVQPGITDRALSALGSGRTEFESLSPPEALSPREREILRLLAGGYSNREIAGGLSLSEGTVKNHVSSILGKLGVRDRTRAVLKAAELGWL